MRVFHTVALTCYAQVIALAYFISYRTCGRWLHGGSSGSSIIAMLRFGRCGGAAAGVARSIAPISALACSFSSDRFRRG